jgi:hypothetical protein
MPIDGRKSLGQAGIVAYCKHTGFRNTTMNRQRQYLFLPLMSIWLNNIGIWILDYIITRVKICHHPTRQFKFLTAAILEGDVSK